MALSTGVMKRGKPTLLAPFLGKTRGSPPVLSLLTTLFWAEDFSCNVRSSAQVFHRIFSYLFVTLRETTQVNFSSLNTSVRKWIILHFQVTALPSAGRLCYKSHGKSCHRVAFTQGCGFFPLSSVCAFPKANKDLCTEAVKHRPEKNPLWFWTRNFKPGCLELVTTSLPGVLHGTLELLP